MLPAQAMADSIAPATTQAVRTWQVAPEADAQSATPRIQQAIDACSQAGGGRVELAPGLYSLTPIQLKNNVELHLSAGAVLRFSRRMEDYPIVWIDDGAGREAGSESPIHADGATNIAITGAGTIDGQGDAWRSVKRSKLSANEWADLVRSGGVVNEKQSEWYPSEAVRDGRGALQKLAGSPAGQSLQAYVPLRSLLRPHLLRLVNCRNVKLQGVTFQNSGSWNVHLSLCDEVDVQGITVFNHPWAQNGDGIDLDSCREVRVADSTINAGDDAICLKSGKDEVGRRRGRPTENVTITRCTVGTGHGGVVIGSEMSGGVRNVVVKDCTFTGTDNGLRFKSTRGRGGVVDGVRVDNVTMSNIGGVAILFDLYYAANGKPGPARETPDDTTPAFQNFSINHVRCDGAKTALQIRGLPEMPLKHIALNDVTIRAKTAGFVTDVDDISFNDVHIAADDGSKVAVTKTSGFSHQNISGFEDAANGQ
ncbi:MAG: glycoside hydrolase family 28 protein [Tepidisphaeraceae bacterium]